jgi:hypothetical protein
MFYTKKIGVLYAKEGNMVQVSERDVQALLGLYAHVSRIYNSSVNAAIAVIFGWLAFFGFSMTIDQQLFYPIKGILLLVGCVMFVFGLYFYIRIWMHGRYLIFMMGSLGLGNYVLTLPRFKILSWLNWRPIDQPTKWTPGELIGLLFLILSFVIPLFLLGYR